MFSVAFPFAPLLAALFILIEVRADGLKYGTLMQRVITNPTTGIGMWQNIILFISMCSVAINCLLLVQVSSWLKFFAYWAARQESSYNGMTCPLKHQLQLHFETQEANGELCLSGECLEQEQKHAEDVCEGSALFILLILGFWIFLIGTKLIMRSCIKDIPHWVRQHVVRSKSQWII